MFIYNRIRINHKKIKIEINIILNMYSYLFKLDYQNVFIFIGIMLNSSRIIVEWGFRLIDIKSL